jgi:hypothetical protein
METNKTSNIEFDIFQIVSYAIGKELNEINRDFINKSAFQLNNQKFNFLYYLMNVKNKEELNYINFDLVNILLAHIMH